MGLFASPSSRVRSRLTVRLIRGGLLSTVTAGLGVGVLAETGPPVLLGGSRFTASGRAAPEIQSVYAHHAASQAGTRYEVFVESDASIKKGPALRASAELRVPEGWQLQLGQRWLPGPPTRWLRDLDRLSGHGNAGRSSRSARLPAQPDGRRMPLAFARWTGLAWLPGVFGLGRDRINHADRSAETTRRAPRDSGLFWAGPDHLIALGREHAAVNLRARLPLFDAGRFFRLGLDLARAPVWVCDASANAVDLLSRLDSCKRRRTLSGRAWLLANRTPEFLAGSLFLERRSEWDLFDAPQQHIAPGANETREHRELFEPLSRHGRSGLASVRLRFARRLQLSAAGQDRGQRGFRLAEAALQPALLRFRENSGEPRGVLRGVALVRYREQRFYGAAAPNVSDDPVRAALPREGERFERMARLAGGLGLRFEYTPAETTIQITGSAEHRGGRVLSLEAETGHRHGGWRLRFGLAYGRFPEHEPVFLFLRAPRPGGGPGVRFIADSSAALIMQLQHDWFSLYLESRVARSDRKTGTFASIAFRAPL